MWRNLIALSLLATLSSGQQPVRLNARIAKADATPCGSPFQVDGTEVFLDGGLVDLEPFVGEIILIEGVEQPLPGCPATNIAVASVAPPTATLTHCGTTAIGCPVRFLVGPPTVSANVLWVSAGPQIYANAGDFGVWFLGLPFAVVNPGPSGVTDLVIPTGPAVIGLTVTLQGFHQEIGPVVEPGALTNPIRFEIVVAGLCHPADCSF